MKGSFQKAKAGFGANTGQAVSAIKAGGKPVRSRGKAVVNMRDSRGGAMRAKGKK